MKKISKKVLYITITFIVTFINIFVNARVVQVYAAALPDPTMLEETYTVIEGGLKTITSNVPGFDVTTLGQLIAAGSCEPLSSKILADTGYKPLEEALSDGSLADVCIVEPAKLIKYMAWDKPQEMFPDWVPTDEEITSAVQNIARETGAGAVIVSKELYEMAQNGVSLTMDTVDDAYLWLQDNVVNKIKEKTNDHISGSKYYDDVSEKPKYEWDGEDTLNKPFKFDYYYTYDYSNGNAHWYNHNWRDSNYPLDFRVCVYQLRELHYFGSHSFQYYRTAINNAGQYSDKDLLTTMTDFEGGSHVYDIKISHNLPVFDNWADANDYLKTGDTSKAINKPGSNVKADNVVVPMQYPQSFPGIITGNPYAMQNYIAYVQSLAQAMQNIINGLETGEQGNIKNLPYTFTNPLELPYVYPDGENIPGVNPVNDPDINPVTVPIKVETIIKYIYPEGWDDPDPDDPDPEPQPGPEQGPENEDIDFKEEWEKIHFIDLSKKFPFCIPFDLVDAVKLFKASPREPQWDVPIVYEKIGLNETVHIDFRQWEKPILFIRGMSVVVFIVALILITKKMLF